MKRAAICLTAVLVAGCATGGNDVADSGMSEPDKATMGRPAVEAMFGGKTEVGTSREGNKYSVYWSPDGTARGTAKGDFGTDTDTGTWTVTADGWFCREFSDWRNGNQGCWKVYDMGKQLVMIATSGNARDRKLAKSALKIGNSRDL